MSDLLDAPGRRHLVVLSAPAGTGKTELLAGWMCSVEGVRATGWVTVDEGDGRVWAPLAEALSDAGVAVPAELMSASADIVPPRLIGELATAVRRASRPVAVVLDDAAPIAARTVAQLDTLLRHCAGRLLVVLSSRTSLPVSPRSRLEDTVLELGAADLRWSDEEARLLLERLGCRVGDDVVSEVNARVGGWTAGLVLLGRALAARGGEDVRAEHAAEDTVEDALRDSGDLEEYMRAEVIDACAPRTRRFLLATATLDVLSPEGVDRLLGVGARRILDEVVREQAFVQPAPHGPRGCYRYVPVFREALEAQRAREGGLTLHAVGHQGEESVLVESLTPRELEVLVHLDDLLTTEEIAAAMFVSVNTVRTHVRSVLRKLGVDRRNAAVRRGRQIGLIAPRESHAW
jgi:LuxR family maltose regulon positive regulatory protein